MEVVIRKPTPDDAAGLARAAHDLGDQYRQAEPDRFQLPDRADFLRWLAEALIQPVPEDELWLVAELDGEAVGEAQARLHEPASNAAIQPGLDVGRRRVYLDYLAVQAEHRGHGIGGRLLGAVEEWARQRGAELLLTDTNLRSNVGAVEFYESHGFEKQAVILRKGLD